MQTKSSHTVMYSLITFRPLSTPSMFKENKSYDLKTGSLIQENNLVFRNSKISKNKICLTIIILYYRSSS